MTGETAKGRSIKVVRTLLPRKRNFAIAHAEARPKTRLEGTNDGQGQKRKPNRRQGFRIADRGPVNPDSPPKGFDEDRGQGQEEKKRQKCQGHGGQGVRRTHGASPVAGGSARAEAGEKRMLSVAETMSSDGLKPPAPLLQQA